MKNKETTKYLKFLGSKLISEGGNVFTDYQVPEACLKMKQGFGRLIRTEFDTGLFIITDPRIYNSSYGYKIKNSFPLESTTYTHYSAILEDKKIL